MKKILSIIALLVFISAFPQDKGITKQMKFNSDLKRANKYYNRSFYAKAIPYYEKVIGKIKNTEIVENLATCYFNIGDLKASARLYGYLVNNDKQNNTYANVYKYVQALKASGNYNDANSVMREYLVAKGDSEALAKFDRDVKTQENIVAIGNRYDLKSLAINTDKSEFGMISYNDFLVYSAAKITTHKKNVFSRYYGWNEEPYLDIYKIHKDSIEHGFLASKSISHNVNTRLHEGAVSFSKDGKTMYFTRNNYDEGKEVRDEKLVTHLKIYKATLVDSVWTNIEALPFNGDNYSVEHPALTPDGKRLYFASDMSGSLGDFDLFYVDIDAVGNYGVPVNLGPDINTIHREQFPFIDDKGDLYFSSNGQFGFGGLDVFWSKNSANGFLKPDNLGLPLNSGFDDFAFFLDETSKSGYVSSNRLKGVGSDDIYKFIELKPLIIEDCKQYIEGLITDKDTKLPIENATVTIIEVLDSEQSETTSHVTKADGAFTDISKCKLTVIVKASAECYQDAERKLYINADRNIKNDASLALVSFESIEKKKQEEEQKKIEIQKQLEIEKQNKLVLEEKKKAEEKIKIQQEKKKKEQVEAEIKKKQIDAIIESEPDIVKKDDKILIKLPIINFDYNLWYIRREVKQILQPVVDLMLKYPKMKIEIGSHTDIRGNEAYNRDLSQKRATSTKEYLVSKGIDASRIVAIGYGESQPIQKCKTEDSCSEEEHEINRRSEFVIKEFL